MTTQLFEKPTRIGSAEVWAVDGEWWVRSAPAAKWQLADAKMIELAKRYAIIMETPH